MSKKGQAAASSVPQGLDSDTIASLQAQQGDVPDIEGEMADYDPEASLSDIYLNEMAGIKTKVYMLDSKMTEIMRNLYTINEKLDRVPHPQQQTDDTPSMSSMGNKPEDVIRQMKENFENFSNQMKADKEEISERIDNMEKRINAK